MSWYALFVETGEESSIKEWIEKRFEKNSIRCIIPRRRLPEKKEGKVRDVVKILFPGYVFIKTEMNFGIYYQLKANPRIYKFLNYLNKKDASMRPESSIAVAAADEKHYFKYIPEEEMSLVLNLMNETEIIDYSQIYIEESRVLVHSGPLTGFEGIIKKIDRHKNRAKVLVQLMGIEKMIDVGIQVLHHPAVI